MKREDILLRYLTFCCNVAEAIVSELKNEDSNNNKSWLYEPTPQRQDALYFELLDQVYSSIFTESNEQD